MGEEETHRDDIEACPENFSVNQETPYSTISLCEIRLKKSSENYYWG